MDTKPWYTSVTIWGGVLAAAAPIIAGITHWQMSAHDMQDFANELALIGSAIGGAVAIYGRYRATTKIG